MSSTATATAPDASAPQHAHTDVLVVGSGPAGAATAILLARHGLEVTMITRSTWVADSPRAHITNQRTMEIMRAVGLEQACRAQATPRELMANHVLCESMAGEEFGRVWSWGNDPARLSEYVTASPAPGCDLPQDRLEPVLLGEAARLGVRIRFQTRFDTLEQDDTGVTAQLTDLLTGRRERIRAAYLVGADGGQSAVADAIDLPFTGKAGVGNAMNVRFTADLSRYVEHRPGSLFAVLQPDRIDGMGNAMIRMVRPWDDWVAGFVHLGERNSRLTVEQAEYEVRQLIGDDSIDVTITGLFPWRINHVVAESYSSGRVLCVGDAVHRHPPMNGLGANTCIQDAFNLAWKLAYVLTGRAGAGLLETYSAERQPIGEQVVDRAIASWRQGADLLHALGLDPAAPVEERLAQIAVLTAPTEGGEARRAAVAAANAEKAYVYHAHGVELNQLYASRAVVDDGETAFVYPRDRELYSQQTSHPGARLPHAWVGVDARTVSTLDLTSPERFTLLTRARGAEWLTAAATVAEEFGIELTALSVGPGCDVADFYGDFARLSEIGESGCLLVRPDQHVAWRQRRLGSDDPAAQLRATLSRVLDRASGLDASENTTPEIRTDAAR